ncbi:MAG: hypothetical protein Unbinned3138contig1000_56 [Prokaryotic dsDNA virus sp.]|nr:MAG: hypothetical protein Unbinned3138contig1000_56 [Prokaryotic dsDNA virus sp.]|tara:strand:- start:19673 stop:20014 length:342 start_codon:yes stop_codon:yes gene_type:complete
MTEREKEMPERIWAAPDETGNTNDCGEWDRFDCDNPNAKEYVRTDAAQNVMARQPTVQEAAQVLLNALNEESELDDLIQAAMDGEADTEGTEEWVFVFRAGLRALSDQGGSDG